MAKVKISEVKCVAGDAGGFMDAKEEISFLRQKFSSLTIRGNYRECLRLIEDNLKLLYFKERWPENFYSSLMLHKRCFLTTDINQPYDAYLEGLLRKNGIPAIFAKLAIGGAERIVWTTDYFKELAIACKNEKDCETALGYVDIMIKLDAFNSNAYLLRGWILQDMKRDSEAAASFERALEINKTNYQASSSLAALYSKTDPKKALAFIGEAIEHMPGEPAFQAAKAAILCGMGNPEGAVAAYDEAHLLDPLNPEYIYQKAELLLLGRQHIAAIRQYGRVLDVDKGHIPTLARLANLTAENQPDLALRYISTVVSAQPENRDAAMLRARLLERTGDVQSAISQYKAALELDPACAAACGSLGNLYLPEAPDCALPYYEKAVELDPAQAEYHLGKGMAHERMNNAEAAISSYKEAIARDKNNARAYASLGYIHMESDPKSAMGYLNKAIAINPENSAYYQAKGELLMQMPHSVKDLIACYDKAVRFDPGNAKIHLVLARLLDEAGSPASAIDHYRSAISLNPKLEEAYYRLACLLEESEPETALLHINKAISMSPLRAVYYYQKSRVFVFLGKRPDAARELQQTLAQDKHNADVLHELEQLLEGDALRAALLQVNCALDISPDSPVFLCARAKLLCDMDKRVSALSQYQKAMAIDPGCHEAIFGVGVLLTEKEDEKALEHLNRAIALEPGNARYHAGKAGFLAKNPHKYQEALACFDEAIALNKQMWDVILAKAKLLEEHGEIFQAIVHYRRTLLVFPDCLEAHARLGTLLADLNPAAAMAYLSHAVELEPENYIHHVWRGRILHAQGDEPGAGNEVGEALRLGGETAQVYFALARVLYERMPKTALEYCRMAMEQVPGKADYRLLCGNIHQNLGDDESAKASYLKAMELDPCCHEAMAGMAGIYFREGKPESLGMIERAIGQNSGNACYHYTRGLILDSMDDDRIQEAIGCLREAVRLAPGDLAYREKLVDLTKKSRAPIKLFLEVGRLNKLRRRLMKDKEEAITFTDYSNAEK